MAWLTDYVLPHWPFVAACLVFAAIGQVAKRSVFSEHRAKTHWVFWWGRQTLPVHPVVAGVMLGLIPGVPASEGIDNAAGKALYFAAAGVASTWVYSTLKSIAKKRGIAVPGESLPPEQPS